jgi:dTDP-4-dehydrorhamnose 3,5-epimerase
MVPHIENLSLPGLLLIKPRVFEDERGYFIESYNEKEWREAGLQASFVQDNQSMSKKNTLRGLHFQHPPFAQGKLVRVVRGAVLDVAVDIRDGSPTYGQAYKVLLSADNFLQLYIPEGFAHGFLTLEDDTVFSYKCTNYYSAAHEDGLLWNDNELGIDWETKNPFLSTKDENNKLFKNFKSPFNY